MSNSVKLERADFVANENFLVNESYPDRDVSYASYAGSDGLRYVVGFEYSSDLVEVWKFEDDTSAAFFMARFQLVLEPWKCTVEPGSIVRMRINVRKSGDGVEYRPVKMIFAGYAASEDWQDLNSSFGQPVLPKIYTSIEDLVEAVNQE